MLLVVALVVAAVLSQEASAQNQGCCTPRQWEGDIAGFDRKARTRFFEFISYDFVNSQLRADVYADIDDRRLRETFIEKWDGVCGTPRFGYF